MQTPSKVYIKHRRKTEGGGGSLYVYDALTEQTRKGPIVQEMLMSNWCKGSILNEQRPVLLGRGCRVTVA
jgi:hypothetical protein